tara:strand:+ start:595 stop:855 length:261 start_codon:yes stop_codon:yes gene_type:complete
MQEGTENEEEEEIEAGYRIDAKGNTRGEKETTRAWEKVESVYDFYDDDQEMVTPPCPNCGLIDDVDYDLDWDQFSCTNVDCPDDTF